VYIGDRFLEKKSGDQTGGSRISNWSSTSSAAGATFFRFWLSNMRWCKRGAFYPRDAMLARVFAIVACLSVRLSVRPSVCHEPVLRQNEEMISSPSGCPTILVF